MKKAISAIAIAATFAVSAQALSTDEFKSWAPTPPMGWNSWDCYGPTVVEAEVKANADYMAEKLKDFGWEYVVVDIRWFVENDKAGGYNQTDPRYVLDEWGRYTPALNRFPSASDGEGFKPLADYCHDKGLKFGIHIMRGIPKEAVSKRLPVKGTDGITADMIANNDSACTWLRDNMKVDWTKPGAQQYYNSIFDLYAQWGVDFVKVDDLSRPYHTAEVEMIRNAIDQCGRPMVLSISPGETPLDKMEHVREHANMWRTVDDFWDNWTQLNYQFGVCAKWAPYISSGGWPDADMLPLGKISIRGERGAERWTQFTEDEQKTMMNLWTIFRSPLMFGGDLPQNDAATDALLTNRDVLAMHHWSQGNREVFNRNNKIGWGAIDPLTGDRYAALFNIDGSDYLNPKDALWRSGTISYLTTGHCIDADVEIPAGSRQLVLVATEGGDGYDCDHADWINPIVVLADGTETDLTAATILRKTCGWGEVHVNSNLNGGQLSVDGTKYDKGIATHANSLLIFELPEGAARFKALAGLDNTGTDQGSKSSVEFMVFNYDPTYRSEMTDQWNAGGKTLKVDPAKQIATSGFVCRQNSSPATDLEADITGAEKLYLVVTNGGDDLSYDHADWVNPMLVKADGTSVSLTDYKWDENPINGWNSPQINKNNDGNRLTIGGSGYDLGFGVNAPSMLTFTLPEGHDFVKFTATVGLDADVDNAPFGATVEFRVFTDDPAPNNDANVALDLTEYGFAQDAKVAVTDLWNGEKLGSYSNDEFAPMLREHASGLYRLSADYDRTPSSITLDTSTCTDFDNLHMLFLLNGASCDGTDYITVMRNDEILEIIPAANELSYTCRAIKGKYKAIYSGTTAVAPSESNVYEIETGAVEEIPASASGLTIVPGKGSVAITADRPQIIPIHDIDGRLVKSIRLSSGTLLVNLPAGIYAAAGDKFHVD